MSAKDEDDAAATVDSAKRSPLLKTIATSEPNTGLSQLQKEVFNAAKEHASKSDDAAIDETFHSYSHLSKKGNAEEQSDEAREITMENAYMATQEIMREWSVNLSACDENLIYSRYFEPTWKSFASDQGQIIGAKQATDFMRSYVSAITDELQPKEETESYA